MLTYQPAPFERRHGGISLLHPLHQMHPSMVQALVVYHKPAGLVAQQLHHVVRGVHEHEHVHAIQVLPHVVGHNPAQLVEVAAHVSRPRVKPELSAGPQAEYGYRLLRIVYTIAGVSPPWMRIFVPAIVRSSILIQFSPAGADLDLPRAPAPMAATITAGGMPPAVTGTNPSGTASRAYFLFHQKYWWGAMPFSSRSFLMEIPLSRLSA